MAEKTFQQWLDDYHNGIADAIREVNGIADIPEQKIRPENFRGRILAFKDKFGLPGVEVEGENSSTLKITGSGYSRVKFESISNSYDIVGEYKIFNMHTGNCAYNVSESTGKTIIEGLPIYKATNFDFVFGEEITKDDYIKSLIKNGANLFGIQGTYTSEVVNDDIPGVTVNSQTITVDPAIGNYTNILVYNPQQGDEIRIDEGVGAGVVLNNTTGYGIHLVNDSDTTISMEGSQNVAIDMGSSQNVTILNSKELISSVIKNGEIVHGIQGTYKVESSNDFTNGELVNVIPQTISQQIKPSAGYDYIKEIVVQPVTSSIDADIVARNIRRGANILGVDGEFDGLPIEFVNGTPIDPSDTITTIYFNQNISISGMNSIFSQLNYIADIYRVAESEDMSSHIWIVRTANGDSYNYEIQLLDNAVNGIVGETFTFSGFQSVSSLTIINQSIPVGQQNDLLKTIISTTPFTIEGVKQELETQYVTASKLREIVVTPASQGYNNDEYTLSKVVVRQVTANVDGNIKAENIKYGVTILGVDGTYTGDTVKGVTESGSDIVVDFNATDYYNVQIKNGTKTKGENVIDIIDCENTQVYLGSSGNSKIDLTYATGTVDIDVDIYRSDLTTKIRGTNIVEMGYAGGVVVNGSTITIDNRYDKYILKEDINATYDIEARYGTLNLSLANTSINLSNGSGSSMAVAIKCNANNTITVYYNADGSLSDIKLNNTSIL